MDLNAIKFNVETSALDASIKKIDEVATALGNMSSKVKEATTVKQNAAKADKEAIDNATALAKLKQEEAKAISLAAKASADEAKAKEAQSNSTKKVVEASESQVKAADKVTEALSGTDRILAKNALTAQVLRGEILKTSDGIVSLGNGFTKSQAAGLANIQLMGATGKEMQTLAGIYNEVNRIMGVDPFDKSASGLFRMRKEISELRSVQDLQAKGFQLTKDEMVNYMREMERLSQIQKSQGYSTQWLTEEQDSLTAAYKAEAITLNKLRAESKQMEDQAKREAQAKIKAAQDVSKAQAFVNKEMERANAAYLAAVGDDKLNVSTSNRLLKMEQALKATGMSAQQAETQLAQYKRTLTAVQKASSDRAVDTISRALGPQITDITVGLATGQSLMTVLLQQGGQLRDQMALAGVAADQMGVAIRKAGSEMVSSVWATGKGVIGGIAGAFLDLGRSAGTSLSTGIVNLQKFIASLVLTEAAYANYSKATDSAFSKTGRFLDFMQNSKAVASVFAGGIAIAASSVIALAVAFVKASNESDNLVKTLSLNSAALGLNASTAYSLAASYKDLGVTVTSSIEALSEMAKTGSFTRTQIDILTPSIVRLNKAAGEDMQTTVARFKELGKDPVKALFDLQAALGTVPPEMIKAAIEAERMGDAMKAMEIATQAADVAAERAAQNIKLYYSPLGSLFNTLKEGAGKMWDAILNVGRGKSAQQTVEEAGNRIIELQNKLGAAGGRPWGWTSMHRDLKEAQKKYDEALKQLVVDLNNADQSAINARKTEGMKLVRELYSPAMALKAEAKGLTVDEYIKRSWIISDPEGKAREAAAANKEFLQAMDAKFRKEWEDIQNKGASKSSGGSSRKPQAPGLFDIGLETGKASNALSEVKKFYDAQSSILENSYKANEISLGSYLSQELTLIENQANKKREIQANLIEQLNLQEQSDLSKLEKWKSTLTETEDKKRAEKMISDTKDKYQKVRESAQSSIIGLVDDTKNAVAKAMQELVKLSQDSAKLFEDFRRGITEREESRKLELEDARLSINLSGEQLAAEKARVAEMRNVSKQIIQQEGYVSKLKTAYEELTTAGRMDEASQAFKDWQAAQQRLSDMKTESETAAGKAAVDAVTKYQLEEYAKLKDGIADALTTALFEGGKAGSKKLREVLIAELRKPITVVVNAVANVITGSVQGAMGAFNKEGSFSSLASFFSTAKDAYNIFTGAYGAGAVSGLGSAATSLGSLTGSSTLTNFGIGVKGGYLAPGLAGPTTAGAPGAMGAGASTGSALGAAATTAAGIYGGVTVGKMISGGYSAWGSGSGNSAVNTGTAVGAAIGSIIPGIGTAIGALIGGAVGGLANRLFGKKLDKLGIEGTFSGESFTGNRYEYYKGGWFSSDETKRKPLDEETKNALSATFAGLKANQKATSDWFGNEAASVLIENYTKKIKLNFKGKSQEEISKMLEKTFGAMSEDMAKYTLAESITTKKGRAIAVNWDRFSKEGETAVQTLDRLKTSLLGVNQILDTLGMELFDISLVSGDLSSSLADVFGGLDKLQSATANYYEKFYSEEEKLATATRQLTETFASMGLTLPATREAFKDLVAAQDLTTASGQLTFAALIGLSDVFYEITNPLEEATQKMKEFTNSILEYINSLSMSEGNASQNYAYAQAVFGQQLLLAKAGDETAMENITSYSDKLIELAKSNAGSALEFETILGSIKAELLGLVTTAPAGSVLTSGLTPSALSASPVVSTASQIAEQTATTQTLLANILTKLTEMQAEDRAEGVQNVVNLNSIAKVVKRIDNGDSIRTFAVTV